MSDGTPLRIGCLGAARIGPGGTDPPGPRQPGCRFSAGAGFATRPGPGRLREAREPHVYDSYEQLVERTTSMPSTSPLPNGSTASGPWRPWQAGKHVLCEKPFTANRPEAELVAAAVPPDLVVMEGLPLALPPIGGPVLDIIAGGELGAVHRVEAAFVFPLPKWSDIRCSWTGRRGADGCRVLPGAHRPHPLPAPSPRSRRARHSQRTQSRPLDPGGACAFPMG